MTNALIAAAQAVVDRWDTPAWKDVEHTAVFINRLRAALTTAAAQPCDSITDAEIDAIAEGMPGGSDGFLKGWGWRQFARAVLAQAAPAAAAATPTAASIAWTALRDLTDPLGEAGVKIMGHVRIYAQRQYEAGLTEGRATPPAQAADSVLEDAARYRWLRAGVRERQGVPVSGHRTMSSNHLRALMEFNFWCTPDELDAAIDAARAQAKEGA